MNMKNDVIARLAAANPAPISLPSRAPRRMPYRRTSIALAIVVAIAVPAGSFAGQLGSLLGITNDGTSVSTSSVLPGDTRLDQALQSMSVGATMQSLGTLNGLTFYASRNADGDFCLAFDHTAQGIGKGVLCDLNTDNFPSADVKAISFPHTLLGVAADDVATVQLVDANGDVIDSTPVVNNLFNGQDAQPDMNAAYLETLDANGTILSKQSLPN
jgi:hypothetical protein